MKAYNSSKIYALFINMSIQNPTQASPPYNFKHKFTWQIFWIILPRNHFYLLQSNSVLIRKFGNKRSFKTWHIYKKELYRTNNSNINFFLKYNQGYNLVLWLQKVSYKLKNILLFLALNYFRSFWPWVFHWRGYYTFPRQELTFL